MQYRKMPGTDKQISILGFGCMRFPVIDNEPSKIDEEKATKMLRYAIDEGMNYIDTAYPYHGTGMTEPGQSEPFVGKVLRDGYREKVNVATKLPSWIVDTREDMDRILNDQLKRLEIDSIDFYLIHSLNEKLWRSMESLGVKDFLDCALKDGRIKNAGFSFHDDSVDLFKEIIDAYDWRFVQIQYNYLDEYYQAGRKGMEYAVSKGLGIIIMEPLKGGSLAENLPETAMETFEKQKSGVSPANWALNWLWNQRDVMVVLSGMSTMEQVEENIHIANESKADSLTNEELEAINKVKVILKNKVMVDCTACGYCMPCPHGVNIPRNFSYYNDFNRFDNPGVKTNAKVIYNRILSEKEKAKTCVECGECETHCPQNIAIIDKLKEVAKAFA